jgi:tripartite-type tricarboxylate transporter receptor subunit TctC
LEGIEMQNRRSDSVPALFSAHDRDVARVLVAATLAAAPFGAHSAQATAAYPDKPIRWIVPYPAGGAADVVSRQIAQKLTERWGQQIVIDNRAGAGGNIGIEIAAKAAPNGYVVVVVPATFTATPALYSKLGYDPVRDFAPITLISSSPLVLIVQPAVPAKSIGELVALAKARPGELNYASSGIGASAHLAAELLKSVAHVDIAHIAYRGQPPALLDMLSGRVQIMFANVPVALPQINAGKLRALAVTTLQRSPQLPGVPTVDESGYRGFEVNQWTGLVAPTGTPKPIIGKVHEGVIAALESQDVRANLSSQGFQPAGSTPEQFAAYIRSEMQKWGKLIRERGIRAD